MSNLARYDYNSYPVGNSSIVPYSPVGNFSIPDYKFNSDLCKVPDWSVSNGYGNPSLLQQQSFNQLAGITSAVLQFNNQLLTNAQSWEASMGLTDLDLELADMDFDSLGFDDLDFSFDL